MLVANLASPDADLLVHSLNVLGYIGDISAVRAMRKLLQRGTGRCQCPLCRL